MVIEETYNDEEGLMKERETYTTFQKPYSPEMITHLLEKAQTNMINNKDRLLDEIKTAVLRKRASRKVAKPLYVPCMALRAEQSDTSDRKTITLDPVRNQEPFPSTATSASQGPPGYYLMPFGCAPFPVGPFSMPYGPFSMPYGPFSMPYGPFSMPYGPFSMPYLPHGSPVMNGWPWGPQQPVPQPASFDQQTGRMPPLPLPSGPLPPMPFPGYCLVPMANPPSPFPVPGNP